MNGVRPTFGLLVLGSPLHGILESLPELGFGGGWQASKRQAARRMAGITDNGVRMDISSSNKERPPAERRVREGTICGVECDGEG